MREEVKAAVAELRELLTSKRADAGDRPFLTVDQVAARAGNVKPETVRRWIDSGQLKARRAGHRWLVSPGDLEDFLADGAPQRETLSNDQHLALVKKRIANTGGGE